jgi:integrase
MKRHSPLSDLACRNLKRGAKQLGDGGALYLVPHAGGTKTWVYRYRLRGKPAAFTIGQYPAISLADARDARVQARAAVIRGEHPKEVRAQEDAKRVEAEANTVAHFVKAWFASRRARPADKKGAWSEGYAHRLSLKVERWIVRPIGALPIASVTWRRVQEALDQAPASMRPMLRSVLDAVFRLAIRHDACERNPADAIRDDVHVVPHVPQPAASTLVEARAVLAAVEAGHRCHAGTILCHRLIALTGLRISEATRLRWDYVQDLAGTAPTLDIPAEAMKGGRRGHVVPLAPQAVAVILQARRVGSGPYVFAAEGVPGACVAAKTVQGMLKRTALPVRHVAHGWRAAFSTIMNDAHPSDRQVIDRMLHHVPNGVSDSEGPYNRSQHLERRRQLAILWADRLLAEARPIGEVVGGIVEVTAKAA